MAAAAAAANLRFRFYSAVRAFSSDSRTSYGFISKAAPSTTEKPTGIISNVASPSPEKPSRYSGKSRSFTLIERVAVIETLLSDDFQATIQSEITARLPKLLRDLGLPPDDLPFTVEDYPRHRRFTLRRDLNEETIRVTADDDAVKLKDESVAVNVSISREKKGTLDVGADVSADKVVVTGMSYTDTDRHESSARYDVEGEGDLQVAMLEFVKERGIESANVGFLYNYMIRKRQHWFQKQPTSDT